MTSVTALEKALRAAEVAGNLQQESYACSQLGAELASAGKYEEALKYQLRDKEVCQMMGDSKGEAKALRMVGEVMAALERYEESLAHTEAFLRVARELQEPAMEQQALATLGRVYLFMGYQEAKHYVTAKKYFNQCLEAVGRIPSKDLENKSEREMMRGRAHHNLAHVSWQTGEKSQFAHHVSRAEEVFTSSGSRLHKDLHSLYDGMVDLLLQSGEEGDREQAFKYAKQSLEVARKVKGAECMVSANITMSKVFLMKEDFEESYIHLVNADNVGVSTALSSDLKANLKRMREIVRARKEITRMDTLTGQQTHKPMEDIADALCKYKVEQKTQVLQMAAKYYQLALSRAQNEGSTEVLPSLNNSLAETFKDLKDYDQALVYYEKQLEIERGQPDQQMYTYSNLAMMKEHLEASPGVVLQLQQQWLQCARDVRNTGQQVGALKEMLRVQQDNQMDEAEETKKQIESLGEEEEVLTSSQKSEASDDMKDLDLTLVNVDEQLLANSRSKRNISHQRFTKKNAKGESELHQAIQKPNQDGKVILLLDKGHPTEVTDNFGWTPLGETVNESNLNYLKILISYDANLDHKNDEGVTPLLSACRKGWLDGVSALIEAGASITKKDNSGHSSLSYLRGHLYDGRRGASEDYTEEVIERLEDLISVFEAAYERLGVDVDQKTCRPSDDDDSQPLPDQGSYTSRGTREDQGSYTREERRSSKKADKKKTNVQDGFQEHSREEGRLTSTLNKREERRLATTQNLSNRREERRLSSTYTSDKERGLTPSQSLNIRRDQRVLTSTQKRRSISSDSEDDLPSISQSLNIRREQRVPTSTQKRRSISSDSEDDLPSISPVRNPPRHVQNPVAETATETYMKTMEALRKSSVTSHLPLTPVNGPLSRKGGRQLDMEDWMVDDIGQRENKRKRPSDEGNKLKKSKTTPPPTIDGDSTDSIASFTIDLTDSSTPKPARSRSPNFKRKNRLSNATKSYQPKIDRIWTSRTPSPTAPSSPPPPPPVMRQTQSVAASGPVTRVRVKVQEEVLLVPLTRPGLTVGWLAEEAATRYYRAEGTQPVISLLSGDGDQLDRGDLVEQVVTSSEVLQAKIISWICKPAHERYKDACADMNAVCYKNVLDKLQLMENTNCLALAVPLKRSQMEPICRAIKISMGLRELVLSRCNMTDNTFSALSSVLSSLKSLARLDLSTNRISIESFSCLSASPPPLLTQLDLSRNPLGDLALPSITQLMTTCPLQQVKLRACFFTKALFQSNRQEFAAQLKKSKVKSIDISSNMLGITGLEILLRCLPPTLSTLNISDCLTPLDLSQSPLLSWVSSLQVWCAGGNPDIDLVGLNLANLGLTDSLVPNLCSALYNCGRLTNLDLSHNPVTPSGLTHLLETVLTHNVPLNQLVCRVGSTGEESWQGTPTTGLVGVLESLLATNSEKLELLVLPLLGEVEGKLNKVWDRCWGARSRHGRDGMGNMVWSVM